VNLFVYDRLISDLEDVLRTATMETASFGHFGGSDLTQTSRQGGTVLKGPVEETDYIREQTKLWRETWLVRPLQDAINGLKAQRELVDKVETLANLLDRRGELDRIKHLSNAGLLMGDDKRYPG
jgi:hypothetical protein